MRCPHSMFVRTAPCCYDEASLATVHDVGAGGHEGYFREEVSYGAEQFIGASEGAESFGHGGVGAEKFGKGGGVGRLLIQTSCLARSSVPESIRGRCRGQRFCKVLRQEGR